MKLQLLSLVFLVAVGSADSAGRSNPGLNTTYSEPPLNMITDGGFETGSLDSWRLLAASGSGIVDDRAGTTNGSYYL